MRSRVVLACLLAAAAAVLGVSLGSFPAGSGLTARRRPTDQESAVIGQVLDSLLARHGIDGSHRRSWRIQIPGAYRVFSRLPVPPEFLSLEFNHDLNAALRPLKAHVVATERAGAGSVTMHCVRNGVTVRSVVFVTETSRGSQDANRQPAERRNSSAATSRQ